MAANVQDYVLDNGLAALKAGATHIHITSAEASSFVNVAAVSLGNKNFGAGNVFPGAIAAGSPNGRKVTTAAVTDGVTTAAGTATNWAIVDATNSRLLAVGALASSQGILNGNAFALAAFDIRLPGQ